MVYKNFYNTFTFLLKFSYLNKSIIIHLLNHYIQKAAYNNLLSVKTNILLNHRKQNNLFYKNLFFRYLKQIIDEKILFFHKI